MSAHEKCIVCGDIPISLESAFKGIVYKDSDGNNYVPIKINICNESDQLAVQCLKEISWQQLLKMILVKNDCNQCSLKVSIDAGSVANICNGCIGGVFLSFDDIWYNASWVWGDSILKDYGWKASFAITTTPTNNEQQDIDQITAAAVNLNKLVTAGHELSNHTLRHKNFAYYTLTEGHTRQEYLDNMVMTIQNHITNIVGYTPPSYIYSSWTGKDQEMSQMLLDAGFQAIRYGTEYYPTNYESVCYNGSSQMLTGFLMDAYTGEQFTDEQILALLDYARVNKKIVALVGHKIVQTITVPTLQTSIDRLKMICQYVVNNGMEFYRLQDLKPGIWI